MRVTTLPPHPALRPYVLRYLTLEVDAPAPLQQYVNPPEGSVLVVLLEGTHQAGFLGGPIEPIPPAFLMGRYDRAAVNLILGRLRAFMIQFRATGVYRLLGISVRELTNQCTDVGAVAGRDLRQWAATLADQPDDAARAAATDRVLLARLFGSALRPHAGRVLETATAACKLITQADGRVSVEGLARQLYTTPRTLLRHFEEVVGLPVRASARITRFLAVRAFLDHHPDVPWSEVVYRFRYTDQSHLVRDFQRYCGEPPSLFRAREHEERLITLVGREPGIAAGASGESLDP